MGMRAPVTLNGSVPPKDVDWKDVKRRIVSALGPEGVYREFKELGVRFENGISPKGKAECHAMDREDRTCSAFVDVTSGIYHSKGATVETLNLFDFALRYGSARFPDWLGTMKHFAALAGIPLDAHRDNKGRILESTYDYTDEAGELLYQVLRYRHASGKKDFRQRRPDGRGGWIYDLEGVRRVLYRLPDVLKYPDYTVVVVEGEKDADRLNELFGATTGGLAIATTSAQGANDTGRWESYAELLRGRNCVVVPDCDPPGARHARGVCGFLDGIAASVKLVELPDVGPKGDVSDWLDQGHTVEEFWELVVAAVPWTGETAATTDADMDQDATAADLIRANAGTRWLWPNWIPLGVLTLLTAEPSTGKTRLGLDLTRRIALGLDWPDGMPMDLGSRRPVVLWVPADSQHSELADTPKMFGFAPEAIVLNTSIGDLYGGTELQTSEQLEDLEERINRQQPALVIIDTITNTSDAKSQDTSDAKRQYKPLQEIAKRTGAAILCVTHTNVAGNTLGRRADEKTRVTLRIERPDPDQEGRKLSVALTRLSLPPPPLGVTMGDCGNTYDNNPPEPPSRSRTENGHATPRQPSPAIQEAIGFLQTALRFGRVRVSHLRTEAEHREPPISAKSLYEAKKYLDIEEDEVEEGPRKQLYKYWHLTAKEPGDEVPF